MSNKTIGNMLSYPVPISELTEIVRGDASLSKQYAIGEKYDGSPVRDGEPGYDNNAKYYSEQMSTIADTKYDDVQVQDGYLVFYANGEEMKRIIYSGGGGGGGGGNDAILTVTNTSGFLSKTIASDTDCYLSFNWTSTLQGAPTGDGTLLVRVSGVIKRSSGITQGDISFNIKDYLNPGRQNVVVIINDVYGNSRAISFTISVISLSMTSTFNDGIPYRSIIPFTYTPIGTIDKTVYFKLDGILLGTQLVAASGERQTYNIPAQNHGAHLLECYCTATIDGEIEPITSNHLYYDIICVEEGVETTIIASNFVQTTAIQYESVNIPYIVYDATGYMYCDVDLIVDGTTVQSLSDVDSSKHTWVWTPTTIGQHTLTISSNGVTKSFILDVEESSIDIHPVTSNMSLYLDAINRSNDEAHPETWIDEDNSISCTLTGFNFSEGGDGWLKGQDGEFLRVTGNARVEIPYLLFGSDFKEDGKTIEFEFRTSSVLDYSATLISCIDQGIGFTMSAQDVMLAAEQTKLKSQFKEDEHVRISFVISSTNNYRLIYCYINGIISNIKRYATDDNFEQGNPVGITIGSNSATIDIYRIRIYDVDLSRFQVVRNWIADMQNGTTKTYYYNLNNNYNEHNILSIDQLPPGLPYMIIEGPLPVNKDDKHIIKGEFVDTSDNTRSFTFENAEIKIQGTSSVNYPRKNYKIKFKNGFYMTYSGETLDNFSMRSDSIPTNTFTFKADFASSEGANNVELVRYYCDLCPYDTPPQLEDPRVRQGIDGFPIVIFYKATADATPSFLGKYNFNNDKGTSEVFGMEDGDESWEIRRNGSNNVIFKTADFTSTYYDTESQTYKPVWTLDFEGRYPDKNTNITNLSALSSWLVTTDRTAATGDPISPVEYGGVTYEYDTSDYRLAKFKYELPEHLNLQSAIFYYIFTELFLMIDSRAKNAFPSFFGTDKWCWLPYDMDTAIGINNEGELVFDYNLEDTDTINEGQDNVFNGQDSVMWCNLRDAFPSDIRTMYKNLRSIKPIENGLSYPTIEQRFENHQKLWSANIFNEDSWFKYVLPLINEGQDYLAMCLGSKEEQRKWWLFNRFRYLDSKYNTGDAANSYIEFRTWDLGDKTFDITPYADIYPTVEWGTGNIKSIRGQRGIESHIEFPSMTNPNDAETKIYSADQIASIGDIGKFHCNRVNVSMAIKLQYLMVGSEGSTNPNLTELTLGNNTLLTTLNAKNCINLTTNVDVQGCKGLVNVYFDNTRITGITLPPSGGIIEKLHLPGTIANFTLIDQPYINDLHFDSNPALSTLRVERVGSDVWNQVFWFTGSTFHSLLENMVGAKRVRLIGWDLSFDTYEQIEDFLSLLDTCKGIDQNGGNVNTAQVAGTIRIDKISASRIQLIQERYPTINVIYNDLAIYVNFYSEDGTLLQEVAGAAGGTAQYSGITPSKETTAQYYFYFDGWSTEIGGPLVYNTSTIFIPVGSTQDINCYAHFNNILRSYTIKFYNGTTEIQSSTLNYGVMPTYNGETPVYNGPEVGDWGNFTGWDPAIHTVVGDENYYAQYEYIASLTRSLLTKRIREVNDVLITTVTDYRFNSCNRITSVYLPNATYLGSYSFSNCSLITSFYAPNVTFTGMNGILTQAVALKEVNFDKLERIPREFITRSQLTSLSLPNATSSYNGYQLAGNYKLKYLHLPKLEYLDYYEFSDCSSLETVYFGALTSMSASSPPFRNCTSLKSIIIDTTSLCTLGAKNQFENSGISNGTGYIYVPTSLYSQYITATNWSTYASQITTIS